MKVFLILTLLVSSSAFAAKGPNGDVLKPNCRFKPGVPPEDDIAHEAFKTHNGVTKQCLDGIWTGTPNPNFENGKDGKLRKAVNKVAR